MTRRRRASSTVGSGSSRRLNTAYTTLDGSAGSWLGVRVWGQAGWWGVCAFVALLAALALARHLPALYKFEESPARTRAGSPDG
ncbi:hypothetical protein [Streptomyces chiangmaiensis]|uniref:Uncharacterized protein n=1 Tax=Streptomyces chiangmaiensis TaxID=766497 RepID=A0ABU7FRN6_9ACTN|nr:hypothetical protein [Streptomyces chiangmaiensis]MED7826493.1 hypothetical protein [Streptomyces chiangmaiensis]